MLGRLLLHPPVTNPAAQYQQRSVRECAGSIWRCRQDYSEYLLSACPCRVVRQRMGGKGTQEWSPLTSLQCGYKRGCRPPKTQGLTGPPPGTAHLLHSRITSGSNTESQWYHATCRCWQPRAAAGKVLLLVLHAGPGCGRAAGGRSPTEPSPPDGEGH